ncbi:MAG TPA: twin-arginine translocation signal domain-containing protein [Chthoniobacterales bacterium]|nr:twin-arginine translocation signal domain-containing protein [Chthoniobacterales bacterium]
MKKFISENGVTSKPQSLSGGKSSSGQTSRNVGRRSFLKGLGATGALLVPASALLINQAKAQEDKDKNDDNGGILSKGDASILRFLCAAEILESDLWEQYWELGGNQTADFASTNPATGIAPAPTGGNTPYTNGLLILDGDMPQYIQDNTDDEFSHANFLLAYLKSKGANTEDLDLLNGTTFRTLKGSTATGSTKKGRLTNLTQLTVDTSYWGRYRSDNLNPDLGDTSFDRAVPSLNVGRHTAIPRTDADSSNTPLITAIAYTAGFHFGFIEQGGTSLYPELAQRVTHPEVLRIVLSIGPTETQHFQTWQDKAGNAQPGLPPLTVFDPINNSTVTFVDLHASTVETLQANLIMPEPTFFLNKGFPKCSIIRPTQTKGAAMGAVKALTADGLFIGQSEDFFELIADLASDADAARRES